PLVDRMVKDSHRPEVEAYRRAAAGKSDLDRTDLAKTKTGGFLGAHARNPVNGEMIPIWIADYVMRSYGTGAIMAAPGHDWRDVAFATTFHLPIVRVVASNAAEQGVPLARAEVEPGVSVNSRNREITLDGLPTDQAKVVITNWLEKKGLGKRTVNYKLRD